MKKRELKRSIITLIRDGEVYGYELQKMLAAQGESVQLGYLYKTLKEMVGEDLLTSKLVPGPTGPKRRHYSLTRRGKRELGKVFGQSIELIHDLYEDYVLKLPPRFFSEKFHLMMKEVYDGRESVALLISEPLSPVHRDFLERICKRKGARRTFLIKPSGLKTEMELPNLTILDGDFDDIPLKDASLDAMIVVDIQDAVNLKTCCKEFRRVLRPSAVMCACAPFMGLGGSDDPLDVGEFMKKTKSTLNMRPYVDKASIKTALTETFDYCDMANMSLLTAFLAGLKPINVVAKPGQATPRIISEHV